MPADQGNDAELLAAAIEQGRTPGSVADAELARHLEIVALLRSQGEMARSQDEAYSPTSDEKARAKQRLMARLAQEGPSGPRTPPPPPVAPVQEHTAPLGRVLQPEFPVAPQDEPTTVMPVVPAAPLNDTVAGPAADIVAEAEPSTVTRLGRPGRRGSRHAMPSRPAGRAGGTRSVARGLRSRTLLVGAAALVAIVAVAGGGIFASRNSLPGDALYPVKRVVESAGLAMTFDKTAKAHRQLELAATRLDEVEQLMAKEPTAAAADPALVQSAITEFDSSTGTGSRGLMSSDDAGGAATLGDLRAWAGEQAARLSLLRSALPSSAVPGADQSISLLDRLLGRTEALSGRSNCLQVTSGAVDDLGPLPAQGTCSPRPAGPQGSPGDGSEGSVGRDGVTSDPSAPGTSGTNDPTTSPESNDPATAPNGVLPGTGSTDGTDSSAPTSTGSGPTSGNVSVPLPLPLLPPITLPPLLPGQPGITIG
ncbi:MAG: hypothetical protein QOF00_6313 [Pseudonocardiales bacterium]|jgi:hypothetical protein|nr:hypothetical protein [Pseudonocardiales bacterium]